MIDENKIRAAKELHEKIDIALRIAADKVYAERERTGETFPYIVNGKVVEITVEQLPVEDLEPLPLTRVESEANNLAENGINK